MAAVRKKSRLPESRDSRAYTLVLEDIRSQFAVFGEALGGLRETMNRRFDKVENDIALLKVAVIQNSHDIKEIRQDITEIRQDIVEIRADIVEIRQDIVEIRQDIVEIRADIAGIRSTLEDKVDRSELVQ